MTRFVASHFVNGVVNSVKPLLFGFFGKVELALRRVVFRSNAETLAALEKEKATLTEKAEAVLSKVDLTLSDLTPKYSGPECKDTGYVGSHRCNCFDRKPNEKR